MDFLIDHYQSFWLATILVHFVALIVSFLSSRTAVKAITLAVVALTAIAFAGGGLYYGCAVGDSVESMLGWIWLFVSLMWCCVAAKQIRSAFSVEGQSAPADREDSCSPGSR